MTQTPSVAVILPCHNEAAAIDAVIAAFRNALPQATVYVYDNASIDGTARVAREAGAEVRFEPQKGKGHAIARAFADVDADIYVVADGDGTYDAQMAPLMVERMRKETVDMIVGVRKGAETGAFRRGHVLGNQIFSWTFRTLFRTDFVDILSGYRVFSRRFVKSFPARARGFEIELEMSAHAALLRLPTLEIETHYGARAAGGESKLDTWRDGFRILRRMFRFLRLHRPRFVYGVIGAGTLALALVFLTPVLTEFFLTGLVPRFPTLIVSVAVALLGIQFFFVGAILDAQAQHFAETKRLAYLRIAPPPRLESP